MANKSIILHLWQGGFSRRRPQRQPGLQAYPYDAEHRLAQLAMTGTFAAASIQDAQAEVPAWSRRRWRSIRCFWPRPLSMCATKGHMKDTPAGLLLAVLSARIGAVRGGLQAVVTSGKVLRGFVQILRSGSGGAQVAGLRPKAMVQNWLNAATDAQLLAASVGNDPSLADVIRMVHPKPKRRNGRPLCLADRPARGHAALPQAVQDLLAFRAGATDKVPDVPFQMLTDLPLTPRQWAEVARKVRGRCCGRAEHAASQGAPSRSPAWSRMWPMCCGIGRGSRRQGDALSASGDAERAVARRLTTGARRPKMTRDGDFCRERAGAGGFWLAVPRRVGVDAVGRDRLSAGATSSACIDVAALVAAAVLRKNPTARVLPFEVRCARPGWRRATPS